MSLYLGENLISGTQIVTDKSERIGQIITSTIPLTDAGLHLLDGALISGSGSYSAFVDYIAGLVTDYPDLFCTEANWQTAVTTYGVCGKFVYDSVNNTVRLPKITGIVEGTTDVTALGDLVEAGLPNITGSLTNNNASVCLMSTHGSTPSGAFVGSGTNTTASRGSGNSISQLDFDASRSNSIYGNSSTVQPQTIKVLYYIVIATSTKTQIEVDIDEITTDLNGKADVDLTNVNNSGTSRGAGWAMPSNTYTDLTVGASGTTYTAPANGWFLLKCAVENKTTLYQAGYQTSYGAKGFVGGYGYNSYGGATVPMLKGQTLTFNYESNTQDRAIRFVYAQGSESEA